MGTYRTAIGRRDSERMGEVAAFKRQVIERPSTLGVYQSKEFGLIRTVSRDNEPWFAAADVCKALEVTNPTDTIKRLDEDERARFKLGPPQGEVNIVNEPGLYSLILGSRKPEAKAFKRWVTHEVLPDLRRTGSYVKPDVKPEVKAEQLKIEAPYSYTMKRWKGIQVVTVRDIMEIAGMTRKTVCRILQKYRDMFKPGEAWKLDAEERRAFREENGNLPWYNWSVDLWILSEAGVKRLFTLTSSNKRDMTVWVKPDTRKPLSLTETLKGIKVGMEYSNAKASPVLRQYIPNARDACTGVIALLSQMELRMDRKKYESCRAALYTMAEMVYSMALLIHSTEVPYIRET